jgi:transcriptional regulator with XRE-family HTH domain
MLEGGEASPGEAQSMKAEWFKDRLRELRTAANLTQQELADKAGMTREGIAQLEIGRREPAWGSVVALAQALGVTCDAFLQPPAAGEEATPEPRPKGRPRKASREGAEATGEEPPAKKRGGKRKGG